MDKFLSVDLEMFVGDHEIRIISSKPLKEIELSIMLLFWEDTIMITKHPLY